MNLHPIRTLLIDDHLAVLQHLGFMLESTGLIKIVAKCEGGNEAVENIRKFTPDIIFIDVHMPEMDGFITAEKILAFDKSSKIIGMSIDTNPENARKLIEIGAKGFVTKTSSPKEFITAIKKVMEGKIYLCKEIR
jgi:two-component system, NarL family, invasion response regulator UvrY